MSFYTELAENSIHRRKIFGRRKKISTSGGRPQVYKKHSQKDPVLHKNESHSAKKEPLNPTPCLYVL